MGPAKSTLLKLLARQQRPPQAPSSSRARRSRIGATGPFARKVAYLPQQTPPASGMLVKELVALGRYPWHGALGRFGQADRDKVAEAMVLTDVEMFADRLVDTLSGGERQRVWLAMLVPRMRNACCWTSRFPPWTWPTRWRSCPWSTGCRPSVGSASWWCCTMSTWRRASATRSSPCTAAG